MHKQIVFSTEGLLEIGIESWPEWDLNPKSLTSAQMLFIYINRVYGYVCIKNKLLKTYNLFIYGYLSLRSFTLGRSRLDIPTKKVSLI